MRKRRITRTQVMRCLLRGEITEGPARSMKGNWEMRIETISAGNAIQVVAALERTDGEGHIVVVTTYPL
jgi:hypothetical protein